MSCRQFVFVLLLIAVPCVLAEQPGCDSKDVAVAVIKANGDPVEGLSPSDFVAQMKKQPVAIQSADYQSGDRRILIVMDSAHELSQDARGAEAEFASALISSARPGDSLGLITARGSTPEVKFGADRSALLHAVSDKGQEQKGGRLGVLDAVAEGITWFGEPRVGDSIVVLALDLEGNHKTNYKSVAKMLEEHRIRLFGVSFGHLQLANQTVGTMNTGREGMGYVDQGIPVANGVGEVNFLPLSVNSGGYIVPQDSLSKMHEFKLTDGKKKELQKTASTMVLVIDKFYVVHLQSDPARAEQWTVSLTQPKAQSLPGSHVLYPHDLSACPAATASR